MRMNKKLATVFLVAITGLVFATVGVLSASGASAPDKVNIENQGYKKDKKPAVEFHHKKHSEDYKLGCTECHHMYTDGKNTWKEGDEVKKCIACHDPEKKDGKVDKLQNAFHKNCKNCHKEKKDDEKAPFKKCTGCHKK